MRRKIRATTVPPRPMLVIEGNITYCTGPVACGKTLQAQQLVMSAVYDGKRVCVVDSHREYDHLGDFTAKHVILLRNFDEDALLKTDADLYVFEMRDFTENTDRVLKFTRELSEQGRSILLVSQEQIKVPVLQS